MAIEVHSSSPPLVQGNGSTLTTAQFTPPAGSLIVSCMAFGSANAANISNTGPSLTWTKYWRVFSDSGGNRGGATVAVAVCNTSQPMTVSAMSTTGSDGGGHKVYVLTGVNLNAPIGAVGRLSVKRSPANVTLYTSTAPGSLAVFMAENWYIEDDTPDSSVTGFTFSSSRVSGITGYKNSPTPAAGTPVQVTITNSDGLGEYNIVALEIMPGASSGGGAPLFQGWGFEI